MEIVNPSGDFRPSGSERRQTREFRSRIAVQEFALSKVGNMAKFLVIVQIAGIASDKETCLVLWMSPHGEAPGIFNIFST